MTKNKRYSLIFLFCLLISLTSIKTPLLANENQPVWLNTAFKNKSLEKNNEFIRYVRINDSIIKFIEISNSNKLNLVDEETPLLFIHGLGGSLNDFEDLIPIASKSHNVIAIDLPGFGGSISFKDNYSINKYADILEEFIYVSPYKKIHLICHSMGGQICITLSLKLPNLVSSLTLIDPAGTYEQGDFIKNIAKQLGKVNLGKLTVNGATTFNSLTWYEQNIMKRVLSPNPLLLMAIDSYKTNLRQDVKSLTIPPLIIWGLNDPIFSVDNAFYLKENIEGATLHIVEDAEHNPQKTHPEQIFSWIVEYQAKTNKGMNND